MRYTRTMLITAITVAALSFAGTANAQQDTRPRRANPATPRRAQSQNSQARPGRAGAPAARGMMFGASQRGMGLAMGNSAAALLRMRTPLGLTDDQVKRLEALQSGVKPASGEADMLRARADLVEAMQGSGNLTAARSAMDKMNKIRTDRAIAQLKLRQDAQAVLTPEQKTKMNELRPRAAGAMRAMRMRQSMP